MNVGALEEIDYLSLIFEFMIIPCKPLLQTPSQDD